MMNPKININETALLIVDITNYCCHQKFETKASFNKIRGMVPKLKRFVQKYRNSGGQVIFINSTPWKKEYLAKNLVELYKDPGCEYYSTDVTGFAEESFELEREENDFTVSKNTYDAFTNPELDKFLKKRNIRYLAIAGVFGDGCVHSTIQGGFSAGYNIIILKDLIETTDVEIRQRLQELLKEYTWPVMFGKTVNSEKFFDMVEAGA